jgi:hypothetical protein
MTNGTKVYIAAAVIIVLALFVVMRPSSEAPEVRRVESSPPASSSQVPPVAADEASAREHLVRRNIFAFDEPPRRVESARRPVQPKQPNPVVIQAATLPRPAERQVERPPDFTYRYIGRFGPEANPIAAFARDGQVVNARPGDVIAERFVLRSIGLESVDLAYVGISGELRVPVAGGAR